MCCWRNWKEYYQKRRPVTGIKHVRLPHDNAPAHMSAIVTFFFSFFFSFFFLQKEKVTVLPQPPYSPDLTSSSFFRYCKPSSLGDISPDRRLELRIPSTLPVYLNRCTVTHSGCGFNDWNYAFLVMGSTLRAWNKENCDYLLFERSLPELAILWNTHRKSSFLKIIEIYNVCLFSLTEMWLVYSTESTLGIADDGADDFFEANDWIE